MRAASHQFGSAPTRILLEIHHLPVTHALSSEAK